MIGNAIERCRQTDPLAAAELAAWILDDVLHRIDGAESVGGARLEAVYAYRSLFDAIYEKEEGWLGPT